MSDLPSSGLQKTAIMLVHMVHLSQQQRLHEGNPVLLFLSIYICIRTNLLICFITLKSVLKVLQKKKDYFICASKVTSIIWHHGPKWKWYFTILTMQSILLGDIRYDVAELLIELVNLIIITVRGLCVDLNNLYSVASSKSGWR